MRRLPTHTQPPQAGPFRIVITAIRPNGTSVVDTKNPDWYLAAPARDEEQRPEPVVLTIPLRPALDQEQAVARAAIVAATLDAWYAGRFLSQHRVKVVDSSGAIVVQLTDVEVDATRARLDARRPVVVGVV